MRFERGKSAQDPIYLRKPSGEYWMEGDVYECLCGCLTQIFGPRNFFVDSFTPRFGLDDEKFYTVAVTDRDGDTHGFVAKVVNAEEFDRTQRGGRFCQNTEKDVQAADGPAEEDDKIDDRRFSDDALDSDVDKEELDAIKEQLKREREIEELNLETTRWEEPSPEGTDSTSMVDSAVPQKDKPTKRRGRGRGKNER